MYIGSLTPWLTTGGINTGSGGTQSHGATGATDSTARSGTAMLLRANQNAKAASDRDERDRAIKKIEDAKEQLEFLKRAGFPPEVIARLAGELLRSVSTAAQQFSQATGAGLLSSMGLGATNPLTGITATSDGAGAVKTAGSPDVPNTDEEQFLAVDERIAMKAYRSVADDAQRSVASDKDQTIANKFKALIDEIRALSRKATQDLSIINQSGDGKDSVDLQSASEEATKRAFSPNSLIV